MQQPGQQPLRPIPVQGSSELQQLLDLVRLSNMHHGRSAFNSVPSGQTPYLPEFSLYNAAQLSGLLNNHGQHHTPQNEQLAQLQQWQTMQNQQNQGGAALSGSAQPALPESSTSRSSLAKGVTRADKGSNAYATRHQAAEQRRRTRINDRLERLREVVPHSERANTATFLEEVIKYVEALKDRVNALEAAQNLPLTCPPTNKEASNSQGCPTCSLNRLGATCEHSNLARHYGGGPFSAGASQSTTFQTSLPPSSGLSSGELPSNLVGPQKDTPDTPPQSLNKEDGNGDQPSAGPAYFPGGQGVDASTNDPEAVVTKKARVETVPSTAAL